MKRGSVVKSAAGHDKGEYFVVIETDGVYALVCDGKRRTLKQPKKKKLKHLTDTGKYIDLSVYTPLYDAHIKKELKGGCYLG